jgi:ATP/maltotriose-dependent transcriptional regulator MalT
MRSVARERRDEAMELAANGAIALLYATASPLFDPDRGRRLSEDNAAMARRLGDRAAEARALWNIVVANVYGGGDAARAIEAGEASLAIARELGEREQTAFTLNDVSRAYMAAGDFETAAERLRQARGLWEDLDNRPMLGENLTLSSLMRLLVGDHAGAMSDARSAVEIAASIGNRWGESFALMSVYRVELDLGRLGEAIGSIERCRELGAEGGFAYAAVATRTDLARLTAYLGDGERALPMAEQALAIAQEHVPPAASMAAVGQAEACLAVGDHDAARVALAQVEGSQLPEPDRTFALTFAGLARARVALAEGDPEDAAQATEEVLQVLTTNAVEILVADALVVLAQVRVAQGRLEEAANALADAIERADRLGETLSLWAALASKAQVLRRRGDERGAAEAERRARAIVETVASTIEDQDLRRSFLTRPDVVALGDA